jgi:hypothetical protein
MKEYILKPIMTPQTVSLTTSFDKPATIKIIPPRQPLPTAVIDPGKPLLKLGLDVHLEFIMAVAQKDHANPHAPRKFTRDQLVAQVKKWVAEGFQVFCVQESCGFGFVLHRELVAAGAQSFLITPIALNGKRKTDKLDARALCLRLSRWLDGNRDELSPIRIPSETEHASAKAPAAGSFWPGPSAVWPIAATARSPSIVMPNCRTAGGVRATGRNSPRSIRGCWACWPSCAN